MQGTLGEIKMWALDWVPQNWAFCDGQILSTQAFPEIFNLIGNSYGGNGTDTFGLPDFRGRVAIGAGMGPGLSDYVRGSEGGFEFNTIATANLPYNLPIELVGATDAGNTNSPDGAFLAQSVEGGTNIQAYNSAPANKVNLGTGSVQVTGAVSAPMSNLQPYSVCHYIICISGETPQRAT